MKVQEVLQTKGHGYSANATEDRCAQDMNLLPVITSDAKALEPTLDPLYDRLQLSDLHAIEEDLSPEDAARLLFLITDWGDSPADMLKKCESKMKLTHGVSNNSTGNDSLTEWAYKNSNNSSWKSSFLESLVAIGRLDILHTLGFGEEEIGVLQSPVCLSSAKVAINAICCTLLQTEATELVKYISKHYLPNNSQAIPDGGKKKELLELYVLYWMDKRIIDLSNLDVLEKALRGIEKQDLAENLAKRRSYARQIGDKNEWSHQKASTRPSYVSSTSNAYPNKSGVCVILNQEEFDCDNTECDLLHKDPDNGSLMHCPRQGSSTDAKSLALLFTKFGCRTQIFKDLKRLDIEVLLEALSQAEDLETFDYLVVCFLSHGNTDSRGKQLIYSSDCQKLLLEDELVRNFEAGYCAALDGKLKLVITQSCMGTDSLPVVPAVADGPNSLAVSAQRDFLFCQAATPGFMAYRIPSEGSLYVRVLCQVLDEIGDREHLVDCIQEVHNRLIPRPISLLDDDRNQILCAVQPQMIVRTRAKFFLVRGSASAGVKLGGDNEDRCVWGPSLQ